MSVEARCHLTHIDFWSISPPIYDPLDLPLLRLVFTVNSLTVGPRAQQMAAKGDLLVNLCMHCVFGVIFQCHPVQYYVWHTPVSNPVCITFVDC